VGQLGKLRWLATTAQDAILPHIAASRSGGNYNKS